MSAAYRVGLTGGLACGKSTAARHLRECGAEVFDADEIVRELTAKGGAALSELRAALGDWVLTADGAYNRPAVRARAFAEPQVREKIEAVLHPLVQQQMRARLHAAASPYAVAVIPLLFESGNWEGFFHHIVTVECPQEMQIARAAKRDGTQDARRIIAVQLPAAERRRRADEVLDNSGTPAELAAAAKALHQRLLAAAQHPAKRDVPTRPPEGGCRA